MLLNDEQIIFDVVQKVASKWESMRNPRQRRYLKKHPESKKKLTRDPKKHRPRVHHQLKHKLRHNKRLKKFPYINL